MLLFIPHWLCGWSFLNLAPPAHLLAVRDRDRLWSSQWESAVLSSRAPMAMAANQPGIRFVPAHANPRLWNLGRWRECCPWPRALLMIITWFHYRLHPRSQPDWFPLSCASLGALSHHPSPQQTLPGALKSSMQGITYWAGNRWAAQGAPPATHALRTPWKLLVLALTEQEKRKSRKEQDSHGPSVCSEWKIGFLEQQPAWMPCYSIGGVLVMNGTQWLCKAAFSLLRVRLLTPSDLLVCLWQRAGAWFLKKNKAHWAQNRMLGAGEFVQDKQVKKGVTREGKSPACKMKLILKPEIIWIGI